MINPAHPLEASYNMVEGDLNMLLLVGALLMRPSVGYTITFQCTAFRQKIYFIIYFGGFLFGFPLNKRTNNMLNNITMKHTNTYDNKIE